MGDRLGSSFQVRTSEDKMHRKDLCWCVGTVYIPPGVRREPVAVAGALQMVSEPTLAVTRVCVGQLREHVGHVSALDAQTCAKGERSCGPMRTSLPFEWGGMC